MRLSTSGSHQRFRDATVKPAQIIVDEKTGRAYSEDAFRHAFAEVRAELAKERPTFELDHLLPGRDIEDPNAFIIDTVKLWFMHLRHTALVRQEEAGSERSLISAVSGHSLKSIDQILERYHVRTRKLARLAFEKRLKAEQPAQPKTEDKQA